MISFANLLFTAFVSSSPAITDVAPTDIIPNSYSPRADLGDNASEQSAHREDSGMASVLEELERLADLKDRGMLSEEEFEELKAQILDEPKVASVESVVPEVFGIAMGQSVESLPVIRSSERTRHVHYIDPPSAHPEINMLSVYAPPGTGVCSVVMSTRSHENDRHGRSALAEYNQRKSEFIAQFGMPSETDRLRTGSRWDDADEFALSFWHGDRQLSSDWELADSQAHSSIKLKVDSAKPNGLYVLLNYKFANYDDCLAEIAAAN